VASATPAPPDPEVKPKATRRSFTAQQKLRILRETDALEPGELGAYLRRRGLYSSHLSTWRKQREEGLLASLSPKKRGAPPKPPEARRVTELERELVQLRRKLERAETIIDVQKKLCGLLGVPPAKRDDLS
jgi:transposase-like protein